MANLIDLSIYRKDPIVIKSLTGEEYTIDGNFSTDFYINLWAMYDKMQSLKSDDYTTSITLVKQMALEIIKLDTTKDPAPTMDTINEQFNDVKALTALVQGVMAAANEAVENPTSKSPKSKSNQGTH